MDHSTILARVITCLLSLLDAANLRNRAYLAEQRVELLTLALEDIARINQNTATPNTLIDSIVRHSLDSSK